MIKINNVILTAHFATSPKVSSLWSSKHFAFYGGNKINLCKNSLQLPLHLDIRKILLERNITYLIKHFIRKKLKVKKVSNLKLKITNIHYSSTIKLKEKEIISTVLPKIRSFVDSCEITQESNVSCPTDVDKIVEKNVNFQALKLNLHQRKAFVKLQVSKNKKATHVTIILNNLNKECKRLVDFFDSERDGFFSKTEL